MTDPRYNYGPDNPQYPQHQGEPPAPKVNVGKLWAGGIGTAVVKIKPKEPKPAPAPQ